MKYDLSNNFAMKLVNKELEVESNCNIYNLRELVELYRVAIEHFEELKDPKFWDFQERLHKILVKPAVLKLMQEESQAIHVRSKAISARLSPRNKTPSKIPAHLPESSTFSEILLESDKYPEETPPKFVNRIVENQRNRTIKETKKAVTDLKSQELSLQERLRSRKERILNVSTGSCSISFAIKDLNSSNTNTTAQSPLSDPRVKVFDGPDLDMESECGDSDLAEHKVTRQELMELRIAKIIEENYSKKTDKITDVKVRYESKINEINGMGRDYDEAIVDIRKKMEEEVVNISKALDEERKYLINQAKIL